MPTVAPVWPLTPVIDVTVAVCAMAIVGHGVGRNHDRGVGLVDLSVIVVAARDVVVVGGAGEAPGVVGVRAGVRVRRVRRHGADGGPGSPFTPVIDVTVAACADAVVGHVVGRDHDRGVGLVDRVGDGRAGDVVVVGGAR